jgi:hypothetical protein
MKMLILVLASIVILAGALNTCENITFSWPGGQGFDNVFYDKMYNLFLANIDI